MRADQPQDNFELEDFKSWRTERSGSDKGGGGLCLYYHESLAPHCWTPEVLSQFSHIKNERQWLLFDGDQKFAFLHVYIACQTNRNDSYIQWNEDLFTLITQETIKLRREGFAVLSLGDYNTRIGQIKGLEGNTPDTNNNTPKFLSFIQQSNLVILNTLPVARGLFSRFMGDSGNNGSLLDYGLIDDDHVNTVTSFIIDEHARYACGSDHALLVANLVFSARPRIEWEYQDVVRYDFGNGSSFVDFQQKLDHFSSEIPLPQFDKLPTDEMLPHLIRTLDESGKASFGIKIKKKKPGRKLPHHIIQAIKEKNDLMIKLAQYKQMEPSLPTQEQITSLSQDLLAAKTNLRDCASDFKLKRINTIRNKVLKNDPSRRKFWRFLKTQIKAAGNITGLYDAKGKMEFQQDNIEEAILDHFGKLFEGQRHPIYPTQNPNAHEQTYMAIQDIDAILETSHHVVTPDKHEAMVCRQFSYVELGRSLSELPDGKASGYDNVPNEFLKNSSSKFKHYLLSFLNKILLEGKVPEELNRGKCMLIYKVRNTEKLWYS